MRSQLLIHFLFAKLNEKLSTEFFHSRTSIKRPQEPLWLLTATLEVPVISGRLMEVDHKLT